MKRYKFADSQIMDTLKRIAVGLAIPEVCQELRMSCAIFIPLGRNHQCPNLALSGITSKQRLTIVTQ